MNNREGNKTKGTEVVKIVFRLVLHAFRKKDTRVEP